MSKANKKDKKGQPSSQLQQQYEQQKRQLLDCQFSMKKMQQRMNDLTEENLRLKRQFQQSRQIHGESVEQLMIKNMANEKRLLGLSNEKTKLEIQNQQKDNKIKQLEKSLFQEQQLHQKEVQECRKIQHFQIAKLDSQLSEYKLYMSERDELQIERQQLREKVEIQKANKLREVADKQRQKVQATDKLKDEMLHKINDMRKNLFSLKREQLTTTTRLTMLQNHQLTSELQYQSKQTEKLIFKNQELQQKIVSLKQDLDIHKDVEDELAKRSHFSKGIIKKLNIKINELEGQIQELKNAACLPKGFNNNNSLQKNNSSVNNSSDEIKNKVKKSDSQQQTLRNDNNTKKIISTLQQQLEKSQKRFVQILNQLQISQKKCTSLSDKLSSVDEKASNLYKMLLRYYDQVLVKNQLTLLQNEAGSNFLKENMPYELDLKSLRQTAIEDWKLEDLTLSVQILLNIIQPYMVRSNLMVPAVRKNILLSEGILSTKKLDVSKSLPKLSTQRKQKQLSQHQMPINIASKIVSSNLRQWGQTVKLNKMCLKRKYKLAQSFRG